MDRKVDSRAMREVNRSIIYDLIRKSGDISRTDLARLSSLTKPTVSTIVEQLVEEGIVSEVGYSQSEPTGGRRARLLRFNPDSAAYVGIRFGVKSTTVALADGLGKVCSAHTTAAFHGDPRASIQSAYEIFERLLKEMSVPQGRVGHVGVAVGGLVEARTGCCVLSPNLGWQDVPLKEWIEEKFATTASVFNVTEAAAVAEARDGVAQGRRSFVWVYFGTGIGSALVNEGVVFRGSRGFAGEIGFCRVTQDGAILEEVASGRAMLERALMQRGSMNTVLREEATIEEMLALADMGDTLCLGVVKEAGAAAGLAVAHLVNIANPELVVIGGGVAEVSRAFVEAVDLEVKKQALGPEIVPVVATGLKGHAVTQGAVVIALENAVQSLRITSPGQ